MRKEYVSVENSAKCQSWEDITSNLTLTYTWTYVSLMKINNMKHFLHTKFRRESTWWVNDSICSWWKAKTFAKTSTIMKIKHFVNSKLELWHLCPPMNTFAFRFCLLCRSNKVKILFVLSRNFQLEIAQRLDGSVNAWTSTKVFLLGFLLYCAL